MKPTLLLVFCVTGCALMGKSDPQVSRYYTPEYDAGAPHAYPAVHHMTAPLRSRAREQGDAEALHQWARQAHELIGDRPAGELVRALHADALAAAAEAHARLGRVTD